MPAKRKTHCQLRRFALKNRGKPAGHHWRKGYTTKKGARVSGCWVKNPKKRRRRRS